MTDSVLQPLQPSRDEQASIIDFGRLERDAQRFRAAWKDARPFEYLAIDDFGAPDALRAIEASFPDPAALNKSRDYIFAKEKYEKNDFSHINPLMSQLYSELTSARFSQWISHVMGNDIFVDPEFHGGGLHSGGAGSFLDMHADFNIHPLHADWFREVNILLYLNPGWQPAWGGSLKLRDSRTGETTEVEPRFNRCVLMLTRDYTLHGYDPIAFPSGRYRRSIAAYGYSTLAAHSAVRARSTLWKSERSAFRRLVAPATLQLISLKNRLFGSGSARNR